MAKKLSTAAKIREYITKHPNEKGIEVAQRFNASVAYVYVIRSQMKKAQSESDTITIKPSQSNVVLSPIMKTEHDPVNHPAHYKTGGIETIDFIEAKELNYNLGNVVKYITRADLKGNRKQDLEKALWYLKREISTHSGVTSQ
jgi:hypothetical protein